MALTIEGILEQRPCTRKIIKIVPLNKLGGKRGLCFFYGMENYNPLTPFFQGGFYATL